MQQKLSQLAAAIVLAGGQGTRLFPLTKSRCKPDVSFGGRYRLVNIPLSNSIHSGIDKIFVISQFFSSKLNFHITQTFPINNGTNIHFLHPEEVYGDKIWYEGTADAVRKNIELFESLPHSYFIILSGDQLYSMDLSDMLNFTIDTSAELCIASLEIGAKEATRMGVLKTDSDQTITDFYEKPKDQKILDSFATKQKTYLASMGIYIFKKTTLLKLLKETSGLDFGKDIIPYQIKTGTKSIAYRYNGYWEDIGTIASFYEANLALIKGNLALNLYDDQKPIYAQPNHFPSARLENTLVGGSIICEGTFIDSSKILHSLIGPRVTIGKNSVIEETIMLGNPLSDHSITWSLKTKTIGENSYLKKVILDEFVQIGNNVQLINTKNIDHYDGDGIFIRDKIIVVASGKTIPDNYIFNP